MGFFGTLFTPIENLLHFVLEALYSITDLAGIGSYGLAIILLTIIIKMILYPLTVKQVKSMKAMQELSPKMKKIQELQAAGYDIRVIHETEFLQILNDENIK